MPYQVTIGIPVYNVEKYIRKTMDSVLAQTFQSIEYLICDDCGTDSSIDIVCEYQQSHARGKDIRIVRQPRNMGVSAARNRIIDEAQGQFLYFMDSDDLIEPETIALLFSHQQQTGADIVFGSYDKIAVYDNNRVETVMQYKSAVFEGEGKLAEYAYSQYGAMQASACNYLVDLSLLHRSGLRFININFWEDMAFTYELVTLCQRAVMLPDITYHYLCRYNSLSNYQHREHIAKDEILRNLKAVDYLKSRTSELKDKAYYPRRCYMVVMTGFYVLCNILKNKKMITPSFSLREMKSMMAHPATFGEIMRFDQVRMQNLFFFVLSKMPARLMVWIVTILGRGKRLI